MTSLAKVDAAIAAVYTRFEEEYDKLPTLDLIYKLEGMLLESAAEGGTSKEILRGIIGHEIQRRMAEHVHIIESALDNAKAELEPGSPAWISIDKLQARKTSYMTRGKLTP